MKDFKMKYYSCHNGHLKDKNTKFKEETKFYLFSYQLKQIDLFYTSPLQTD